MRQVWVALLLFVSACSGGKPAARGLRVPLPDGWAATPGAPGVLQVGPKGRVVVTLERRSAPLPAVAVLAAAVQAEGATVTHSEEIPGRALVRYAKSGAPEALLAVRTLEPGVLLLCASTPGAELEELESSLALCAAVRLEAAP